MKNKKAASCSEELYILKSVIEEFPLSVQTFAPDGLCLTCNRAWAKLTKVKRSMVMGKYNVLKDPQLEARHILNKIKKVFISDRQIFLPAVPYISPEKTRRLLGKPLADYLEKKIMKRMYMDVWHYSVRARDGKIARGVFIHRDVKKRIIKEFEMLARLERLRSDIKKIRGVKTASF